MSKRANDIVEPNKRQRIDEVAPDPRIEEEISDNECDGEIEGVEPNDDFIEGVEPINDSLPISEIQSGSGERFADVDEEPVNIELNGILKTSQLILFNILTIDFL